MPTFPFHNPKASSPPISRLGERLIPQVVRKTLPNGLTVVVQKDPSHPLVAFHAVVRSGSAHEGPWLGTGVSHVLEHMLFKGTSRRPVGEVEREARSYGGTSQGFTSYDTTAYQLTVNREFWSEAADLLIDQLFFPTMDPEEFTKERQVVLRELKLGKDSPEHTLWELLFENAYRIHPYRVPIIGYEPLVTKLTREEALEVHKTRYVPNNMVIGICGDLDPQSAIRRIEELTSKIPPGIVSPQALPQEPLPVAPREISQEVEAAHALVALGFPSVPFAHPDMVPLDLLAWILGGGLGSRLERALKETGIVYSVSSSDMTPRDRGLFMVTMRLEPHSIPIALEKLSEEIDRARWQYFSLQEIEAAKRALLTEYLADRQTVTGQAADLALFEVLVGDPTFAYRYLQEVNRVKPEDLERVAAGYLLSDRATTVKLLPKGSAQPVKETVPRAIPEPRMERIVLENGLRLILRQDQRLPLVTLQVSMLGGVRYEKEKTNGISQLTARMLLKGTRRRSAQEMTDLVREMGGTLSPSSGRNSIGLTLEVVSSDISKATALLGELILESTFPAEELEKERSLLLAELKAKEENPFPWGMKRVAATLFTVHPYRLDPLGDPPSVSTLKSEDLAAFYQRIVHPKSMVVSVVGDFDREKLVALLKDSLGHLPARETHLVAVPEEPPLVSSREHLEVSPRQEGLVMIGFPGLKVTDPRVASLDLLETILSGGAGRLFQVVRERRGLAYTVGAFAIHGMDPGAFVLYAVTEPTHIQTIRESLLQEIRSLRSASIDEKEFHQAQQGLLGAHRMARQTQAALASQIGLDELYGLGYDFFQRYEAQVQAARPADLKELAKAILDPDRCVVVIGKPVEDASVNAHEAVPELAEVNGKR